MSDFKDIAARLRAEHEDRIASHRNERESERRSREAMVDRCSDLLDKHVLPILEQARAAFRPEGVSGSIWQKYDVMNRHESVLPTLIFQCHQPTDPGWRWRLEGPKVIFTFLGDILRAEIREDASDNSKLILVGESQPGEHIPLVQQAVSRALSNYFEFVEEYKKSKL